MALPIAISISVDALAKAGGSGPVPLLLDVYPSASGAYSLRKLRTLYAGSAIRVRRDIDNTESDIGFSSGQLDTAALMSFVGYQNLTSNSGDFTAATWVRNGFATSILNVIGSNGTTDITTFTENTSNSTHTVYTVTGSKLTGAVGQYTISAYFKQGTRRYVQFQYDNGTAAVGVVIDTQNWTITNLTTTATISSSGIINSGGGLYRVYVTGTISGTNTLGTAIYGLSSSTQDTVTYTGNGSTIIAGEIQLTSGSLQPYQSTATAFRNANGYVTKWYDQSGSSRDAIQATAGNQPRIVNAGVIETQNSKPTVRFLSASTTYFSITNNVTLTALSIFTPFLYTASTQNNTRFFSINATGGNGYDGYIPMIQFNASNNWGSYADAAFRAYSNSLANTFQLWTNIETGTAINNYKNGANLASYPFVLNRVINNMVIGFGVFASPVDGRFDGKIPEMVIYQSDQSSNRVGIESNINSFYTIY